MAYLDIKNWNNIISNIDQSDLYQPDSKRFGIETNPPCYFIIRITF
jgi:hypothetical protein